jgi:prevent-host-death family protein
MKQMTAEEARRNFADLLNEVGFQGELVEVTRHGKPLVVLGPAGQSMRQRLESIVSAELGSTAPGLVDQLADLIDEARIRTGRDAKFRSKG